MSKHPARRGRKWFKPYMFNSYQLFWSNRQSQTSKMGCSSGCNATLARWDIDINRFSWKMSIESIWNLMSDFNKHGQNTLTYCNVNVALIEFSDIMFEEMFWTYGYENRNIGIQRSKRFDCYKTIYIRQMKVACARRVAPSKLSCKMRSFVFHNADFYGSFRLWEDVIELLVSSKEIQNFVSLHKFSIFAKWCNSCKIRKYIRRD